MSDHDTIEDPVLRAVSDNRRRSRRVDAERERLRRLIRRHEASLEKLPRYGIGSAVRAIATIITEHTGLSTEVGGPFGLNREYGLTVNERDEVAGAYMMFRPAEGADDDIEMIDLESDNGHYPSGSLARLNGMHRKGLPVPTLDELLAMVDRQRSERRLRHAIAKEA